MARFISVTFGFVVVLMLQCATAQTVHVVGDNMGWTIPQGGAQAYTNWANGKNFMVGDILMFNFATNAHDVLQVPKASFDACTSSNAIGDVITTGPTNVTLASSGEHYYICTVGRHCQAGQKLAVTVSSATPGASPPSTTPRPTSPTTPSAPSPVSNNTPADCTPAPTPGPMAGAPAGSRTRKSSDPSTPSPPGSSASNVLASIFVSILAVIMSLSF